ncbi:hypothetical protein HSACCH_00929 [Halanaerobium saccharolyticum subsp. saccharolyticum DSM 6643]|uniref:Uncharacterized protein n=1 Tax=Halanaerobium saccharolyticum subsp. saccharolyticum DSM 6643 TaxID=1293054 RepID=M5E020_9FIRM|nr:hypothetical protein HSACCH_00929 [Halanaerobium saccharolyticum subsp. saccharolyticum DSM 6643]
MIISFRLSSANINKTSFLFLIFYVCLFSFVFVYDYILFVFVCQHNFQKT